MTPEQLRVYLDQAKTPAERLAAIQSMDPETQASLGPTPEMAAPAPVTNLVSQTYGAPSAPAAPPPATDVAQQAYGAPPPPKPSVVIPEQTVTPGGTGWQPRTEKPRGPAPFLRDYMQGQDGGAPGGAPAEPAFDVDPEAGPVTTYTEDAQAMRRYDGLLPDSITTGEAGRAMDLQARGRQNLQDQFEAQDYARQATMRAERAAIDRQDAADAAVQQREVERQRRLQELETNYRDMADQITSEPIDSERLWNSKSTGEKILGGIAVALGQIGTAAGMNNIAWEKLQKDIDRDIEAQKANKALQQNRLAAEGSLYDMARQRFGSEAAADEAMRASAYRRIQAELTRFAESAKSPERKAALEGLLVQNEQAALDSEQRLRVALQNDEAQENAARARLAAANAPMTPIQKLKQLKTVRGLQRGIHEDELAIAGEADPKDTVKVPLWGVRLPKDQAKDAIGMSSAYQQARVALEDLKKAGRSGRNYGAARERFILAYKGTKGTGMGDEAAMERMGTVLPTRYSTDFDAAIATARKAVDDEEKALRQGYGVDPAPYKPPSEKK